MTDKLKGRLGLILDKIPPCRLLADVGTDHAYIPIAAVSCGRAQRAVAADVNPGPLERAAENISNKGLGGKIETVLSDGLDRLREDADCIVMAGMGGDLMSGIIERGSGRIGKDCTLILQPQSRLPEFRRFLHGSGFRIEDETWVEDMGKRYVVMTVRRGTQSFTEEIHYLFGRHGIIKKDPVLKGLLESELEKFLAVQQDMTAGGSGQDSEALRTVKEKAGACEKALAEYGNKGGADGKDSL